MERWGDLGGSVGEVVYVALTGLVLLAVVAVTYRFSGPFGRRVSRRLLVLLAVLVAVGVGLDAVHTLLSAPGRLEIALAVLEDGGEMVVLSLMTSFGLAVAAGPTDGRGPAGSKGGTAGASRAVGGRPAPVPDAAEPAEH
jgi:hypothetical protein